MIDSFKLYFYGQGKFFLVYLFSCPLLEAFSTPLSKPRFTFFILYSFHNHLNDEKNTIVSMIMGLFFIRFDCLAHQ